MHFIQKTEHQKDSKPRSRFKLNFIKFFLIIELVLPYSLLSLILLTQLFIKLLFLRITVMNDSEKDHLYSPRHSQGLI